MNQQNKNLLFLLLSVINSFSLFGQIIEIDENNIDMVLNESKNPVVIDFYADWCGPCKTVEPIFEAVAEKLSEEFVFAKVNIDKHKQFTQECNVIAIPACVVMQNRKVLGKTTTGDMQEEALVNKIREMARGPKDLSKASEEEKLQVLREGMFERDIEKIKRSLDAGVDVNKQFADGSSPMLLAVSVVPQLFGDQAREVLELLFDAGGSRYIEIQTPAGLQKGDIIELVKGTITNFENLTKVYRNLEAFLNEIESKEEVVQEEAQK